MRCCVLVVVVCGFLLTVNLSSEMLQRVHEGHLGIERCKRRPRDLISWPELSPHVKALLPHPVSNVKWPPTSLTAWNGVEADGHKDIPGSKLAEQMIIGTEVVRGKDWQQKYGDQDGGIGSKGIVTRGLLNGTVRVEWDAGRSYSYRMGRDNKFDLTLATLFSLPPHVNTATSTSTSTSTSTTIRVMTRKQLTGPDIVRSIKYGTQVVRGQDWDWGDQDGRGNVGSVIEVDNENKFVVVQWNDIDRFAYRMGFEGKYDLMLA